MSDWNDQEDLGLEFVDEFDKSEPCYSFDLFRVMFDTNRGSYRTGEDSGCSCPSPFEDFRSDADWGEPMTAREVVAEIRKVRVETECIDGKYATATSVREHATERGLW